MHASRSMQNCTYAMLCWAAIKLGGLNCLDVWRMRLTKWLIRVKGFHGGIFLSGIALCYDLELRDNFYDVFLVGHLPLAKPRNTLLYETTIGCGGKLHY